MKTKFVPLAATAVAALIMGVSAHAQNVQVQSNDAAKARDTMDASMKAAARGQKLGMLSGKLNPQPVQLANGAVAQELDATTLMYSVARVNADGTIERVCVNGSEAAAKAMKAPAFAKRVSQMSKEQIHVSK